MLEKDIRFIDEKKMKPFLVVMPFGYPADPNTIPFNGGFENVRDGFSKDLIGDVIPYVQAHYPVYTDREHRAIAGLSRTDLLAFPVPGTWSIQQIVLHRMARFAFSVAAAAAARLQHT